MTCADVERVLPELLDGAPDGVGGTNNAALQSAFDAHVKSCPDCSELVAELKLVAREAHEMTASEEPAPRVWVKIAAQLRAEGLIREPEPVPARPVLVPTSPRYGWSTWWLAPVAAALLIVGSYVVSHKQATPVAQQPAVTPAPVNAAAVPAPPAQVVAETPAATPETASAPVTAPAGQEVARQAVPSAPTARFKEHAEPTAEDRQFLSVVSTRAPSMRATYENQLQAVNSDIRETQTYVDRNPGDADARQHLMDAYQQKALLYQIALDRIQ